MSARTTEGSAAVSTTPSLSWWQQPRWLLTSLAVAVIIILGLTIAVIVLAVGDDTQQSPASSPPTSTPYFPPGAALPTANAPVVSRLGEPISLQLNGVPALTYAVTSIDVDGPCPETAIPPRDGHLVLVGLDVQTTAGFNAASARGILSPYGDSGWSIIGPDGVTKTGLTSGPTYICADGQIPQAFMPNQHYAYKLAFDTQHTTGTLQYQAGSQINRWTF